MSKEQLKPIKVFVSYSWTTPEHQMRVLAWAERLRGDGIDVVLDKWDLREGQDKYAFMEQMVTNAEITKVVVFSDAAYAKKAEVRNHRLSQRMFTLKLISRSSYQSMCEYLEGKPCLPTFLGSRIFVDFSSPEQGKRGMG